MSSGPKLVATVRSVAHPHSSAPILKQLKNEKTKVYVEGGVLTLAHRSGSMPEMAFIGLNLGVARVGTNDVWAGQARDSRRNEVFFSYSLLPPPGSTSTGPRIEMWFGSSAPKLPPTSSILKGEAKTHTIKSSALGEERTFFIHMPPSVPKSIPSMYFADGVCNDPAAIVETEIVAGRMRPFAIIGTSSGGYQGVREKPYDPEQDFRAHEYLKMYGKSRYGKHLTFFTEEVRIFVEQTYGVSTHRHDRVIGGFSNGGAFALTASVDAEDLYGASIPLSIAAYDRDAFRKSATNKLLPRYFMAAGELESFVVGTKDAAKIVEACKASCTMDTYVAGHDYPMWRLMFFKVAQTLFKI